MSNLNYSKVLQAILLAIPVLAIIYSSTQSMRANAWYFSARNELQVLSQPVKNEAELLPAKNAIELATSIEPKHPHYWHLAAHLDMLALGAQTHTRTTEQTLQLYKQPEQALLNSVALRRSWSQTWIALALVVSFQEGPTERVIEYVTQAKKVGPYKFDVHLGVLQIAFNNWHLLPPKFKALYINELKLAAKYGYQFNDVFKAAQQAERLPILCLSLKFGSHFEAIRSSYMYKKYCG